MSSLWTVLIAVDFSHRARETFRFACSPVGGDRAHSEGLEERLRAARRVKIGHH
jgi:hypothetical protein